MVAEALARTHCPATAALASFAEIDGTVVSWTPEEKGDTIERLHALTTRGWRPQGICTLLDDHCSQIEGWTLAGTELLTETPRVFRRQSCPRCGARFTYRRDDSGESVRVRCLRVSEAGCTCLGCGALWAPAEFHWLARLLGCEPITA
ncbi:MAG: hypothetical protein ACM4D3_18710 [Candidatus Sericytochromatia bacterium]